MNVNESADSVSLIDSLAQQYDAQLENDPSRPEPEIAAEVVVADEEVILDEPKIEPPQHWPKDRQEVFSKASPELQKVWLDREKEFDRGINEKSSELRDIKARNDQYESVIAPLRNTLNMQGMNEYQWIGQMAAYTTALQNDPLGVIKAVAQQYNVDLSALNRGSDEFIDPQLQGLKGEIAALKQQLSQTAQTQASQVQQQQVQMIDDFRNQKGADGSTLHPHFDAVIDDIAVMASGYRMQGKQPPALSDLYERAVRMNPQLMESERAKTEQAKKLQSIEAARKAKGASARPRDTATDAGTVKPKSLKEQLAQQYDALSG